MKEIIYQAILARGVEDRGDFRFAVHEAAHGIETGAKKWSSDTLNRALEDTSTFRANLWVSELRARIVEERVCAEFNIPYVLKDWLHMSIMEAVKWRLPYADLDLSMDVCGQLRTQDLTETIVGEIFNLAGE